MNEVLLARFGIDESKLLGSGGESWVYALDEHRVLRVVKKGVAGRSYLEARKSFYDSLPARTYAFPKVLTIEEHGDVLVSFEDRIPGTSLTAVLAKLSSADKQIALANFLAAAESLRDIVYPDAPYGEILTAKPITSASWIGFLVAQVQKAVAEYGIVAEVPGVESVAADLTKAISSMGSAPKVLVHGDYAAGNVMMDDKLQVTGIIDFSVMSAVGDPLLDVAGALLFLEVTPGYTPEDSAILQAIIVGKYGPGVLKTMDLYRLYYSFYFFFARDDVPLHKWCLKNLSAVHS